MPSTPQTKRPDRKTRKRKQTKDEIIDAARRAILDDGIDRFTLSAVADELGLTKPALYYYFKSKEAVLFELMVRDWSALGAAVDEAVQKTTNAADAVEALIRAHYLHYQHQLGVFELSHRTPFEAAKHLSPSDLERIRPLNDLMYGGVESRARADQEHDRFPADRDPRRFAFIAHTSVIGLLNMMAITASASDPLLHSDKDLIDDLVDTFRRTARGPG